MTALFISTCFALLAVIVLFNVLYFCVVLLRIGDTGGKVSGDALFNFRQQRYVAKYLALLTAQEQSRWYNIFLKHSPTITLVLFFVCMSSLALSFLHDGR
ncbi:hypothetical protein RHOFW104T7_00235 [Rhodanobacter thiooxydans]|uniref:Uncharacterized protein n=1 Tax=Rhodanobacter thiooxydans TaxID=416169 RepID=A0A154QE79_9GAMM|nr:hypothetical protein [Rhodanobacter thiooxydans]EIL96455.1 hypothetical protein UUA_17927 [Rhodanobacter thiooxydans LCS2]KZC22532.1 hypothetical protein RHOFW104T7_00235 [Rhodanobacter thiooxydans]